MAASGWPPLPSTEGDRLPAPRALARDRALRRPGGLLPGRARAHRVPDPHPHFHPASTTLALLGSRTSRPRPCSSDLVRTPMRAYRPPVPRRRPPVCSSPRTTRAARLPPAGLPPSVVAARPHPKEKQAAYQANPEMHPRPAHDQNINDSNHIEDFGAAPSSEPAGRPPRKPVSDAQSRGRGRPK